MTALNVGAPVQPHARVRPVPWRQMIWVTWRQHRAALIGMATLLGALAAYMSIVGPESRSIYPAANGCRPASAVCTALVNIFNGRDYALQAVPALIGAFVGAPVLARELESGTFRYAWTQGFGRWRWTLAKLVALAVVVTVATAAISVLFSWYYQPYLAAGNQTLAANQASPLTPALFDLRGVAFAAWTLAAFAIGGLAGVLVRRVVPAILVTLIGYAGLALATGLYLRQHYLAPLLTSRLNVPGSAWIISQQWFTKGGRPVSKAVLSQALQAGPPQLAGKGGVPKTIGSWQYLVQHGYTLRSTYQPASRFWTFQWIEGGWLLALSVLLIGLTVWVVHRREP